MKKQLRRTALKTGLALALITTAVTAASPAWSMQIFVDTPTNGALTLDVEPSDTVDNVKAKIQDKIGVAPTNQCLIFNETFLDDEKALSDYDIRKEYRINLIELPMWATWTITPDDPALGREVSNSINSNPEATLFEVTSGALPTGVALNESTGVVTGHFDESGAFNATIGVTTICGETELNWSGTVPGALPSTGRGDSNFFGSIGSGLLALASGIALMLIRRKVAHTN